MTRGIVYLVGAGPGDPGLLTIKGQQVLQRADVVFYDHLVSPRLLKYCRPAAQLVYVGKEADKHTAKQGSIHALLIKAARAGKTVVRLKGGDPFVFGRGGEEALALASAKIPCEVVPGVTSAIAVPAYAGIPVTHRQLSSSVAIVTGHEDPTKASSQLRWRELATACDTLVCLMGVSMLPNIVSKLRQYGRRSTTPCAVIRWGTRGIQQTVTGTLRTIVDRVTRAALRPPAILVVGDVVSLRPHLNWFETKALFGKRIVVTRASEKAASLSEQLEALGADVEELPAIELAPVASNGRLGRLLRASRKPDWVFFTSPEGIGWFSRMLKPYRKDVRWLADCHIGAIGPKTALAIESAGLHVDYVPKRFNQEAMVEALPSRIVRGKRAWILSAQESRDVLETGLRRRGAQVTTLSIYRTVMPRALTAGIATVVDQPCDAVTVTSASCVEHVWQALRAAGRPRRFRRLRFASIGPVTSDAVRARGGRVLVEAATSTIEGLVHALVRRWR